MVKIKQRYRLQYWNFYKETLSIQPFLNRPKDDPGGFFVRAVSENFDIRSSRPGAPRNSFTELMTIDQAKAFISRKQRMLGQDVKLVRGLVLNDKDDKRVFFEKPITFVTQKKKKHKKRK